MNYPQKELTNTTFVNMNNAILRENWRNIVLLGKNTATYKFALAATLIDISYRQQKEVLSLEELALPYALHLAEHLKHYPKQITLKSSLFIETCQRFIDGLVDKETLHDITIKEGFKYVLDSYHIVRNEPVDKLFFIYKKYDKNIQFTDNFFELFHTSELRQILRIENEARWRLVEAAWQLSPKLDMSNIQYNSDTNTFYAFDANKKKNNIVDAFEALNGYQKGCCFYCSREIPILSNGKLQAEMTPFVPSSFMLRINRKHQTNFTNPNELWNLVLSCSVCGKDRKDADYVPSGIKLKDLYHRNEYLAGSYPLRKTLLRQITNKKYFQEYFSDI